VAGAPQLPTCSHNPPQYIPFPTPTQVPHSDLPGTFFLSTFRPQWGVDPSQRARIAWAIRSNARPHRHCLWGRKIVGRPVSRVLSSACGWFTGRSLPPIRTAWAIIYLGPHVAVGLKQPTRSSRGTSSPPLASELRSCLALLPMAVAWPPTLLSAPVGSYSTFSPLPGYPAVVFCGPMRGFHRPGIIRHRALWSADFPQIAYATRDRPADPTILCIIPP
jgi:hypothetical protein